MGGILSSKADRASDVREDWKARYSKYIASAQWKNIRQQLFQMRGKKCERCGMGGPSLSVHHLTYERLGKESPKDLIILCPGCHEAEDKKRAEAGKIRSTAAREAARIDSALFTWCQRRGIDDPGCSSDAELDRFYSWIDQQDS